MRILMSIGNIKMNLNNNILALGVTICTFSITNISNCMEHDAIKDSQLQEYKDVFPDNNYSTSFKKEL